MTRPVVVPLALALLAPGLLGAQLPTSSGAPAGPAGIGGGVCFQNLFGVGICGVTESCGALDECDAENPCPDGRICTPNTCCPSSLGGVCTEPVGDNPGCANPGVCGSFDPSCAPILAHEDFAGLTVDETVVCGSGSQMFVEDSCAASPFTTSPLDHGRWGTEPGSCTTYGSASSRVFTGPGPLDISSCAGSATLEFDYLLDLQEIGEYDRAFVTVRVDGGQELVVASNQPPGQQAFTSQSMSCEGGIVPMGRLVEDGSWRHFRHPLGPGASATIRFYGEIYDNLFNNGQGWLFEDVRFDCTDLVFADDFESANLLPWSATTAPPPLVTISSGGGSCPGDVPNFKPCDGPEGNCSNFKTAEGSALCLNDFFCGAPCTASTDCGAGEVCVTDTCCGEPVCAPARCDPKSFIVFGPEASKPGAPAASAAGRTRG